MKRISREFSAKLEEMLVIPFMVIIYSCILLPLVILCYQVFTRLKTGEWSGLTLNDLAIRLNINLDALQEPGWTFIKNIFLNFLEWPLALSILVIVFIGGWLLILIFCVIAKIFMDSGSNEESEKETAWSAEIKENYNTGQYSDNNSE